MRKSSFLDKGVVLGFCFSIDTHHRECRRYLFRESVTGYYTQDVRDAFDRNRDRMIWDHRAEILHHVREINDLGLSGRLTADDSERIRRDVVTRSDYPNSWRYLRDYYPKRISTPVRSVFAELREIAREIETNAHRRFVEIEEAVGLWERTADYPTVETALEEIRKSKEEDLWICIDAHDLAERIDGYTELATTDFNDLIKRGRRALILEHTALDDVVGVGVTT